MLRPAICLLSCLMVVLLRPGANAETTYPRTQEERVADEKARHLLRVLDLAQEGLDAKTEYDNDVLDCQGHPSPSCTELAAAKFKLRRIEINKERNLEDNLHQKNPWKLSMAPVKNWP